MHSMQIRTGAKEAMIDITPRLEDLLKDQGTASGVMTVYTPHTTTGLTINEGADPDVCRDILAHLRTMVPQHAGFRHSEGNSDAHIKATLFGSSVQIIIHDGRLLLGTWQRVFLGEFDGPRTRTLWVKMLT
ncbi:MAG: secondary thiamine-phosphate synthase enzyme YjbQ [Desulfomicrobium sp.]|nr:secondary thiamine-phosphate synthase enzyme YjbQ [Pseudomonadota bacterium]MBV1712734.1 secondary thiamine-phosphate synthase enzyme YjbQ [Desulfomicrobium sp.]MBU4571704.1 secondary thiamine-phosphate synthase enzyme YjbQ [Pseudomonadota bacterium]MBU4595853.1 secondary thiamine-phosphate synthase enzyme YjbQ [Pseudomonadota bacterium]MBV1721157.1 secondary thiamine-phosphate synthase enzyme YjbQ [Desulfomicrobium sp.]